MGRQETGPRPVLPRLVCLTRLHYLFSLIYMQDHANLMSHCVDCTGWPSFSSGACRKSSCSYYPIERMIFTPEDDGIQPWVIKRWTNIARLFHLPGMSERLTRFIAGNGLEKLSLYYYSTRYSKYSGNFLRSPALSLLTPSEHHICGSGILITHQ